MPFCSFVTLKLINRPKRYLREAHIRQNLSVVNRKKCLHTLGFNDEITIHEQINSVAAVEQSFFVANR